MSEVTSINNILNEITDFDLISKREMVSGFEALYEFEAIGNEICDNGSTCKNWKMTGEYIVRTDLFGEHSLEIEVKVRGPLNFN
jgi:hypothetical protein